jgi:hypothetical protein
MSKEKAKEILYKHEEKSGGAINHWQAQWILDAMIEYNESIVKSNIVLGNVSQQRELLDFLKELTELDYPAIATNLRKKAEKLLKSNCG